MFKLQVLKRSEPKFTALYFSVFLYKLRLSGCGCRFAQKSFYGQNEF
jgi:hypothetical protein